MRRRSTTTTTSNTFYEYVLGPSMTYTCAVFPDRGRHARGGAGDQVRPGRPKLDLQEGSGSSTSGAGWGGMVRHAPRASTASTSSASRSRASRRPGPSAGSKERDHPPRCGSWTTATWRVRRATRSRRSGLTEHIPGEELPSYLAGSVTTSSRRRLLNPHHAQLTTPSRRVPGRSSTATCSPTGSLPARARSSRPSGLRSSPAPGEHPVHYAKRSRAGAATSRRTGTPASTRSASGPRRCGACTWRARAGVRAQRDPAAPRPRDQDRGHRGQRLP